MKELVAGGKFFEGVRWQGGRWWCSDLYEHHVLAISPEGEREIVVSGLAGQPSGLGWLPDGSLLVSSMLTRQLLRADAAGRVSEHAAVGDLVVGLINDMVVSPSGHAYVGSFGFDLFGGGTPAPGNVVHVTPDGRASVGAADLLFPNGMVLTPDGRTLVVAETFGARFTAFDVARDGSLGNRRVWAQVGTTPAYDSLATLLKIDFAPDGCSLDAEGCVWVADAIGNRAVRVREGGEILDVRRGREGWGLYSVALGGRDGKKLLACAAPSFADHERKAANEAVLDEYEVQVPAA